MTKIRFEKIADQDYYVHIGLNPAIGRVQKMDDNYWWAYLTGSVRKGVYPTRGEAVDWLEREHKKREAAQ